MNKINQIKIEKNVCEDKYRKYSQETQFEINKCYEEKLILEKKNEELTNLNRKYKEEMRIMLEKNRKIYDLIKELEECNEKIHKSEIEKKIIITKYESVFKLYQ